MPPPGGANCTTDSLEKKQPLQSKGRPGPQRTLFTTYSNIHPAGKENYQRPLYPGPGYDDMHDENYTSDRLYGQKTQGKRVLMEAPLIQSKKQKTTNESTQHPLEPFGILKDDGSKPSQSYATLIGIAILTAPGKRLTLAQIYKWISDTFSYYSATETGWQNSIRHNLSLNKAFVKQERPKDDPGKGNYWIIAPGEEDKFFKDKQPKKAGTIENAPIMAAPLSIPAPPMKLERPPSSYRNSTPAPAELPPPPALFMPIQPLPKPHVELSSDATIPASDVYQPDEEAPEEDRYANAGSAQPILSSPPAHMMQSSPPIPRHVQRRNDTPPPIIRFPRSSAPRSHKRAFASMDDSGYFSSINSSALRGGAPDRQLPSEDDRPRIKRGRAEEEIARLRGSSYDSPTKTSRRTRSSLCAESLAWAAPSSSPLRRGLVYDTHQMLPPLTPAVKLKAPMRPPPSVSPNTNLRLHRERVRELVGSPVRGASVLDDCLPWSPAFNIGDSLFPDLETDFDLFIDASADLLSAPGNGSPEKKRPAKRPRLDHAPHSTSVLSDISNVHNFTKTRSVTSTPRLNFTPTLAPSFESPSKALGLGSPSKFQSPALSIASFDLPQDDYSEFLADGIAEDSGMDILQGFAKIGASNGGAMRGNSSRNGIRRSFTSRF